MPNTNRGFKPYNQEELDRIKKSYEQFRKEGYLNKNGSLKKGAIKIGAFYAIIPPSRLSVFERSDNQVISTLRQPGNIKLKQARLDTTIQVELVFPDLESINNNFRPILAQFIRAPFVPIDNYHLNMLLNPTVKWEIEQNIKKEENDGVIVRTFKDDYIDENNIGQSRAITEYVNNAILNKVQEERKEVNQKVKELSQEIKNLTTKLHNEQDEKKKDELQIELDIKTKKYNEYVNENVVNYDQNAHIARIQENMSISEQEPESTVFIVAMQNITVNNIPGYSQALQCTLTFNIMTSLPYSNDFAFLKYDEDFIKQSTYYSARKYLRFPKSWIELNNITIYEEPTVDTTYDLSKSEPFINYLLPLLNGNTISKNLTVDMNNENNLFVESNIKTNFHEVENDNLFLTKIISIQDGDTITIDNNITVRLYGVSAYEVPHANDEKINNQLLVQMGRTGLSKEQVYKIGYQHLNILKKYLKVNQKVYIKCIGKDTYGRLLGVVYTLNKLNVNKNIILDSESIDSNVPSMRGMETDKLGLLNDIQLSYSTKQNWLRMVTNDDFNSIDMKLNIVELSEQEDDIINDISSMVNNLNDYMTITFLQNFKCGNSVIKSLKDLYNIFTEDINYIQRTITLDVTKQLLKEYKVGDKSFENEPFTLSKEYILYDQKGNTYKITRNASKTGQWTYQKLLNVFKKMPGFVNFISNSSEYYKSYIELSLRSKYGYQTRYHLPIGTSKDTVITGMTASMSHKMAPIWMQLYDYPVFQHMGRNDFAIELNLQTCDAKFLAALRDLSIKYNKNRRIRGKSQDSFFISLMNSIELDMDLNSNGFFKVLGIGNVIPESIAMQTIPGKPGWIDVNMMLLQNDIDIQKVEKLSWTNEFNEDIINTATDKLMDSYVCRSNVKYSSLNNDYPFLTKNLFPPMRNFAFKHMGSIFYENASSIPELSENKEIININIDGNKYKKLSESNVIKDEQYKDIYNYKLPFTDEYGSLLQGYHIATLSKDYASGGFGYTRKNSEGELVLHCGVDIVKDSTKSSDKYGDEIRANVSGKVVVNQNYPDFGNTLIIQKNINNLVFQFVYAHLSDKSPLKVGSTVNIGDKIGRVGKTGKAFINDSRLKAHLHYEVLLKVFDNKVVADRSMSVYSKFGRSADFCIDPTNISIVNGKLQVYKVNNKGSKNSTKNKTIIKDTIDLENFIPLDNYSNYEYENLSEKLKYIVDDVDVENLYHEHYSGNYIYQLVKAYIYYTYNRDFKNPTFDNLIKEANDYYTKANTLENLVKSGVIDTKYNVNIVNLDIDEKNKFRNYINYCRSLSPSFVVDAAVESLKNTLFMKIKTAIGYYNIDYKKFIDDYKSFDKIPVGKGNSTGLPLIITEYTTINHIMTSLDGALHQVFNLNVPDYYNNIKKSLMRTLVLKYIQHASSEFLNWYNENLRQEDKITLFDLLKINKIDQGETNYADMELPYISGAYNSTTVDFYFKRYNDTVNFNTIRDKYDLYMEDAKNSWKFNNLKGMYLEEKLKELPEYVEENINNLINNNTKAEFNDDNSTNISEINILLTMFNRLSDRNALPDSNTSQEYIDWIKENSTRLISQDINKNKLKTYRFLYQFIDLVHLQEEYQNLNIKGLDSKLRDKLIKRYNDKLSEQVNTLKSVLLTPLDKLENIYTPYTMANYYDILNRLEMDYNNYKGRNRERCIENCFPTAKIYFIEEDNKSWQKLDDYYSYDAIEDIKVVKSAKSAADYCELTISNLSEVLTNPLAVYKKENILEDNTEKEQQVDSIFLSEGTTIMVKLGYDNNPALLDRVFMGKITSIEYGDRIHIKAQGFGAELHEPINNGLPDRLGYASSMKLHGDLVEYALSSMTSLDHFGARSVFEKLGLEDNYTGYPSQDRLNSFFDVTVNQIKSAFFKRYLPILNIFKTIGTYDPRVENIYLSYSNSEALGYRIINNVGNIFDHTKTDLEKGNFNLKGIVSSTTQLIDNMSTLGQKFIYSLRDSIIKAGWRADFTWIYPENYSFWDLLSEIKNYYPDYILTILPYNDWVEGRQRNTIYLGPRKGYYKYTDVFDNSKSSLEFTNHIKNIREYERLIYNKSERNKIYDIIDKIKKECNIINKIENSIERSTKKQEFLKNYKDILYILNIVFKKSLKVNKYNIDIEDPNLIYNVNNILDRFDKDIVLPEYIAKGEVLDIATTSAKNTNVKWRINNPDDLLGYDENGNLKEIFPQYQQVQNYYIVNSYSQIISNNITASSEDIYNKVVLTYPEDPTTDIDKYTESKEFYVSDAIEDSHIKTKIVHQTNIDPLNTIIPWLTPFLRKWNADWSTVGELRYAYLPPETLVGYNILADCMRPMYRGTLEVFGMPELKPYDIIQINDIYNQMDGPIEIEQVIHHYSQNGFTTTIIPNAIINTKDPSITQELYLKKGFNLPIFGNVNGANLFSVASNICGILGSVVSAYQSFQNIGNFVRTDVNSKEFQLYYNSYKKLVDKHVIKAKTGEVNSKVLEKVKGTLSEAELRIINSNQKLRNLFSQKRTLEMKISNYQTKIKTLREKINKAISRFKDKSDKHVTEYYKKQIKSNNKTIKSIENIAKEEKLQGAKEIKALNKQIKEIESEMKTIQDDLVNLNKDLFNFFNQSSNAIEEEIKLDTSMLANKSKELGKKEKELKELKDGVKASLKEFKAEVNKFKEKNAKNLEILKNINNAQTNENKLKELEKLLNEVHKDLEQMDKIKLSMEAVLLSMTIASKSYDLYHGAEESNNSLESLNTGLTNMNAATGIFALGTGIIRSTIFPSIKLAGASLGLLANPWLAVILLGAGIIFDYFNARIFNWGLGKVLGRNCIYITPLNLKRVPMVAGLKGYNVYIDIETHINDSIYSFLNIPKEYLEGLTSEDISN